MVEIMEGNNDNFPASERGRLSGSISSYQILWRVKGRGDFPCLIGGNIEVLGINEA